MSRREMKAEREGLPEEQLAHNIQEAFFTKLGEKFELEEIRYALERREKKGVTNTFITLESKEDKYLVRINGTLWPPYERRYEASALEALARNRVNTGVLYNGDDFQICEAFRDELKLSEILEHAGAPDTKKALRLVATEMARYHQILTRNRLDYPIANMVRDAARKMKEKFEGQDNLYPVELDAIILTCQKILTVFTQSRTAQKFSHNDLFTNSIFVDLTTDSVTIVDWEYSARAYWSNDLAKLCMPLSPEIADLLSKYYYGEMSGKMNTKMPEAMRQEVQFNSYLHKFLTIAWSIKPANIDRLEDAVKSMSLERESFSGELDKLHKSATTNPVVSFVQSHSYLVSAGLFATAAIGVAAYTRTSPS